MAGSPRADAARRTDAPTTGVSARFLTRSGLGAAVAAITLAVLGWWWRYEELVVVAAGTAAALAVAMWSARVAHAAQIVRRVTTMRVARGEPVRVRYRINNAGRRRSSTATIVDECDGEVSRVQIPSVAESPGAPTDQPGSLSKSVQ